MKTASLREDWEGRTINGRFALLEWLGGTADYGVFLTIRQGAQKAAIKVVLADGADADAYIAQWEAATTLAHPHLLRVLEIGRCDIDGVGVVYIVTEHGDVALSRILADEAIGASEAIEVIESLLDVLSYLHGKGIVHGHVNPSNILFVGDEVKLAGGDFLVVDGVQRQVRKPATCDAPEVVSGKITAAADMWSVGMVLAEAMTQRSPRWDWAGKGGPIVPDSLPQPFFGIVQECLRLDPARRCTIPEIRARLGSQAPQPPANASTSNPSLQFAATKPVPQQAPVAAAAAPIATSAQPATPPAESAAPPPGPISAVPISAVSASEVPESKPVPNPVPDPIPSQPIPASAAPNPAPAAPISAPATQAPAPVQPVSVAPAPSISAPPIRRPERAAPQAERRVPIAEPRFGYEEPDDYLRPPTLFASGEEEPRRFRLFPTLIGVLVVFAFIAFLLERSNPAIFSSLVGTQKSTTPAQTKPQPQSPPPSSVATQPEAQTTPAPAQTAQSQSPAIPSEAQSAPASTQSKTAQPGTAEPAPTQTAPTQPAPAQPAPAPTRSPGLERSTDGSSTVPMTGQSVPPPLTRPARASSYENSRGGVAKQVLPSVSPNARRSMRRPMEISVLVSVDRNGTVTSATYGSYGPGNYFARIAVRAAHDWTFTPPMLDGRPESSFWTLHFFFDRARTEATARQDTR